MKKLFAKNKVLFSLAIVVIVCVILILIKMLGYFYGDGKKDKYGSRLNGIETHVVPSDLNKKIKNLYDEKAGLKSVDIKVYGRIIYITQNFAKEVNVSQAKEQAVKSLEALEEDLLNYYDIQLIIDSEEKETIGFPLMGYKNSSNSELVWMLNSNEGDKNEEKE